MEEPVYTPSDYLRYISEATGKPLSDLSLPEDAILTYSRLAFRHAAKATASKHAGWLPPNTRVGSVNHRRVSVALSMIGAPYAVTLLEEMIARGVRRIYEVGSAGAIAPRLAPGDTVLVDSALPDEGTSRHYFKKRVSFQASKELTGRLAQSLHHLGVEYSTCSAWTTDAPYRETPSKISAMTKRGACIVNMETSAVFALAEFRGVEAASVQTISDVLDSNGWRPAFRDTRVSAGLRLCVDAVLNCIGSR